MYHSLQTRVSKIFKSEAASHQNLNHTSVYAENSIDLVTMQKIFKKKKQKICTYLKGIYYTLGIMSKRL